MDLKIQDGLKLVKNINPEAQLFFRTAYVKNQDLTKQPDDENIYWSINGHEGSRTIKKLTFIYCFGVDIDSRKNGIPDEIVFERIKKLEKEYNLSPNLINETNGGFHLVFSVEKALYKSYEKEIPKIYKFLNEKLGGDIRFQWITGIMKLPYSKDCITKKIITPIKTDFSYKYKISDLVKIINKEYSLNFDENKKTEKLVEEKELKLKKSQKIKDTFFEEIEKLGILTELNLLSDDLDKRAQIGVIDNLKKEGINFTFDRDLFIDGHRIQIDKVNNNVSDWAKKFRNGIYNFLLNYVFKEVKPSKNPYLEMCFFVGKYYGIKKVDTENHIKINRFIYNNFINGVYEIDYEKIIRDYGEENKEVISYIKKELLDENYRLKGYGIFFLVNILNIAEDKQFTFTKLTTNTILKNSYWSKDNIKTNKGRIIHSIQYLEYLKVKVESFEYKNEIGYKELVNTKIKSTPYLNLISFLKLEMIKNHTYITLTLFNGLLGIGHYDRGEVEYVNKKVLEVNYNELGLYFYIDSRKKEISGQKVLNISIDEIDRILGTQTNDNTNLDVKISRLRKKIKKILKFISKKLVVSEVKNDVNIIRISKR
ncbi:MAG: hypothetical protein AB7E37_03990 [Candidatus Altimarinota bacterium]